MTFAWKIFFPILGFMLALDFIWLSLMSKSFYLPQFGSLARIIDGKFQPIYWAGGVVYLVMAFGVVFFALPRVGESWLEAALVGALYGFTIYAVYDFTNFATLHRWPPILLLVDLSWGTALGSLATIAAKFMRDNVR